MDPTEQEDLMPNRILKDSICTSATIDQLSCDEEVFFYRLMVQCDDFGRFHAHPGIVRGYCFPRKPDLAIEQVERWLSKLTRVGLIHVYEAEGDSYLQVITWERHQQQRAKRSKYPSPPEAPTPPGLQADAQHLQSSDINRAAGVIEREQVPSSRARAESNPIQSESDIESNPVPAGSTRAQAHAPTREGHLRVVDWDDDPGPVVEPEPAPKPGRLYKPIDDEFIEEQVVEFAPQLGGPEHARLTIDKALNHRALKNATDKRRYLTNWLKSDALRYREQAKAGRANGHRARPGFYINPDEPADLGIESTVLGA